MTSSESSSNPAIKGADSTPVESIFDCWNQTGVEGDGTCRELERFVHCRNCPVYASAGQRLLSRELPADYRSDWANHIALGKAAAAGGKVSAIIFRVGLEWLALPTYVFQEIVEHRPVHSIPHRRNGVVLGLVNVRGELLLCICVSRLLGFGYSVPMDTPQSTYRRLLVISWDARRLVFPADEVHGVHRFQPEELAPHHKMGSPPAVMFTRAVFRWNEKLVGMLEPDLLFSTLSRSVS